MSKCIRVACDLFSLYACTVMVSVLKWNEHDTKEG